MTTTIRTTYHVQIAHPETRSGQWGRYADHGEGYDEYARALAQYNRLRNHPVFKACWFQVVERQTVSTDTICT